MRAVSHAALFNGLEYIHCDVFAFAPYSGNSLAVFPDCADLTGNQMLSITQELRHFESIFLTPSEEDNRFSARVFDLVEELPFAGHPIIGAACVMHQMTDSTNGPKKAWTIELLGGREVSVITHRTGNQLKATLDQGRPEIIGTVPIDQVSKFAKAFNLQRADLVQNLPLEVISTGLRYLVIPVVSGLENARIVRPDLDNLLCQVNAEFAYLFDAVRFEGRHWNNDGVVEDVATGSAAGVIGAYALRHGLSQSGETISLKQGHFIGRPSEIDITAFGQAEDIERVEVAGAVSILGRGVLEALPEAI